MGLSIKFNFNISFNRRQENENTRENRDATDPMLFIQQAEEELKALKDTRSKATLDNYQTALRSLRLYLDGNADLSGLDGQLLKGYEHWLHERRICPNTVSCYMRSIRSLAAMMYGDESRSLFKEVFTGCSKTSKRALSKEEIVRIKALNLIPGTFLSLARDLFLFSFATFGMPFVDMAFLRRQQVGEHYITYYRHKTGQCIKIPIEPMMLRIISRYQSEDSDYVFPLLHATQPDEAYAEYQKMLNRYNLALKKIGAMAKIGIRLTSYVSRHSWASIAFGSNVELPVISKAMGHANPKHTLIYIREINDDRLSEANKEILEGLMD